MFRRSMALSTETPDAEFDVINGGFWTIPTLGLQELRYGLRDSSKVEIQGYAGHVQRHVLLASPRLCEIVAAFFSGKNDVPLPDPQGCLFVWVCRRVSAGKGLNQWFFSTHPPGEGSTSTARAAYIRNLKASQRRNSSIGITICRIAHEKTKHPAKTTRQAYSTSILKLLFSGQGTKPSTVR